MSTRVCDPFRSRPARAALIGVLLAMLLSIVGVPGAASVPSAAAAGVRWFDGGITYSNVVNCPSIIWGSPYTELGAGAYVGFSADPETSTPGVGQTYYVRVAVAALGSTCSGQLADLNVKLPPNTSLAIGAGSPIRCFVGTSELNGTRCPQALSSSAGSYGPGFLRIADVDTTYSGLWPLPAGGAQLSVQIPVVSSAVLAGATLEGRVRVLDGNDSPTLAPTQGVYVFSSQPTILHDTASTTFTSGTWPTTIRSAALLYPKGTSGNAWFDLLSGPGGSVVFSDGPAVVPAGQSNAYEVWSDWTPYPFQIQPNTTLTWRFRYVTSGGTTYTGPEQTFTTPPANTAIVGTGSAASCTSAALTNALASGQATITFQCGAQPAEIQLAGEVVVPAGRTIDGDDKITLRAAPNQRALRFTAGTNEVRDLTITGGNSSGCGGGVLVTGGFTAMREVRIVGNRAVTGGGACVQSPNGLGIYSSSVTGNVATQAGGGLYVSGGADVQTTDISGNTAGNDGGGAYTSADLTLIAVSLVDNTATGQGGGLRAIGSGAVTLAATTIADNRAASGAGVSLGATGADYFVGLTIAGNVASTAGRGGGIESTTALTVRNTIVSANTPANCATNASLRTFGTGVDNLDSGTTCAFAGTNIVTATDPRLRPLGLWGGTTRSMPPIPGSPVIDRGTNGWCWNPDQRGVTAPRDGDGNGSTVCDIGSVEHVPEALAPTATAVSGVTPLTASAGASVTWTVQFSETITGFDAADVSLVAAGPTGSAITGVSPTGPSRVYTVTATAGAGAGTLRLDLLDDDSIRDVSDNALRGPSGANGAVAGQTYTITAAAGGAGGGGAGGGGGGGGAGGVASYVPLVPARLLETRSDPGLSTVDGQAFGAGVVPAGGVVELQVAGRAGIPADASAVVLNVAVTGTLGSGFITVFPCGSDRPNAANLNYSAGQTVPNLVVAKIGAGGKVCLYTLAGTHLIADVNGYFPAGSSYAPLVPARLLETRADPGLSTVDGQAFAGGLVPAGGVVELQVAGRAGIPADASAVVLNVAVTGTLGSGFITVFPCGSDRPNAANLNYSAGQTVPNLVVAKIGSGGKVCLYTLAATHLIADVNGYFPAGSSYAPLVPARLLETRSDPGLSTVDGQAFGAGVVPAGGVVELQVAGRAGIPADASAVVLNVAVTGTLGSGFITVFPCGSDRPNAANLNYSAGQTVPNLVVAKIGAGGKVCLYTLAATHLIADVNGYFPA